MSAGDALLYLKAFAANQPDGDNPDKLRKAITEIEAVLQFDAQFEELRAAGLEVSLYCYPEELDSAGLDIATRYMADAETLSAMDFYDAIADTASGAIAALHAKWTEAGRPNYA